MTERVYYTADVRMKSITHLLYNGSAHRNVRLAKAGEIVRLDEWEQKVLALQREAQYRSDPQEEKLIAFLQQAKSNYVPPDPPVVLNWYQPGPDGW
jgi:hypothetical protein